MPSKTQNLNSPDSFSNEIANSEEIHKILLFEAGKQNELLQIFN